MDVWRSRQPKGFSLHQLLNLIKLAHKTGALVVSGPRGAGTARLYFREGKLVDAGLDGRDPTLTHVLLRTGKITL